MKIGNIELKNRIVVAPMAGITDLPYRLILKEMGAALMSTELVSAKGITYDNKNNAVILATDRKESPIALQLFGGDPFFICKAAEKVYEDYDIIDINMGCPVLKVVRCGEGAALMKDVKRASNIISMLARVLGDKKPITVKMRIGYDNNHINAVDFAKAMEDAGASAITIHGRTKSEMYEGEVHYDIIKKVKDAVKIPIIGNGNIFDIYSCKKMFDETGCDAVALARGIKGNPWLVKECIEYIENEKIIDKPSKIEIKNMMLRFVDMEINFRGEERAINELRHHLAWFINGFNNATKLRLRLNFIKNKKELIDLINEI